MVKPWVFEFLRAPTDKGVLIQRPRANVTAAEVSEQFRAYWEMWLRAENYGPFVIDRVDANGVVRAGRDRGNPQGKLSAGGGETVGSRGDIDERPAVVPPSAKVICVGLNYRLHAIEAKLPIPERPVVFFALGEHADHGWAARATG